MASIQDGTLTQSAPQRPFRRRLLMTLAGVLLVVCAVAAALFLFPSRHATPYAALEAYTAAVETGDRAALDSIIGDSEQRGALIDRHADKPMTATTVSMEMMESAVWWAVEIRYEMFGKQPYSERLTVHPRSDLPDRSIDYVIEPAP